MCVRNKSAGLRHRCLRHLLIAIVIIIEDLYISKRLGPLLLNVSVDQFAHAEIITQEALLQAVAFNAVNECTSLEQAIKRYGVVQVDYAANN